jgi:hypothetical protein
VLLAAAASRRVSDLRDTVARHDSVEVVVFGFFFDVEVVDEVVVLAGG